MGLVVSFSLDAVEEESQPESDGRPDTLSPDRVCGGSDRWEVKTELEARWEGEIFFSEIDSGDPLWEPREGIMTWTINHTKT